MWDGFLGTRASFMFDFVVVAMVAILPLLAYSISLAKRGHYAWHKTMQVALGVILLVAVVAFEVDVRLASFSGRGWQYAAEQSLYFETWVYPSLYIHLVFSILTPVLWIVTIVLAWRRFETPPQPGPHTPLHKRLAWPATLGMVLTAVTGWVFYYLAFVA